MAEKRTGRQTPTQSVALPYTVTYGKEAVDLYNSTGRTVQEWQENLLFDILSINDDGLWVHAKFGYSIPRRNGKSEVLMMRELYGLKHGERILHTAHRTTTSHATWEKVCGLLDAAEIKYKATKQMGLETIRCEDGGLINFRTRSSKGGLGEGYDLLIVDEAQEYTDDQETALKYVVTDSSNPQTIFCGTPPTAVSAGTVFLKYRNSMIKGEGIDSGWAEWSVDELSDPQNIELWYECNPSLGTIFTERAVRAEIGTDEIDFNIQRLGLWLKYNQKSEISKTEWEALTCEDNILPELKGKLYVGIKYGKDGTNVAMSIAVRTWDDRVFVESIDCRTIRTGNDWIVRFLSCADVEKVVVDGVGGQASLGAVMKDFGLKPPIFPTVKEVVMANSSFEQALEDKAFCHMNQPSLMQSASNCEKRAIGTNGGFGYKSIRSDTEIALLDSVILAYWACSTSKPNRKQKISY